MRTRWRKRRHPHTSPKRKRGKKLSSSLALRAGEHGYF
jgi:hypothetical protein